MVLGKRKANYFDQSTLTDSARIIMRQLENVLLNSKSKNEMVNTTKKMSKGVIKYAKKHPYMSAATAVAVGGTLALLLRNSNFLDHSEEGFDARSSTKLDNIMKNVSDEVREHSMELFDAVVSNYVRRNPLYATGAVLGMGLLMSLLSRK